MIRCTEEGGELSIWDEVTERTRFSFNPNWFFFIQLFLNFEEFTMVEVRGHSYNA